LAKFIKILVASIGGGLVLGAGIRLGEAIASQLPASGADSRGRLATRLGDLEGRLQSLEAENPATIVDTEDPQIQQWSETGQRLRGELKEWIDESVTARLAELETRLRSDSERGQKQMLDAFAESVQTRMVQRISGLEEEVAAQSAAMSELREYSLRTEQSMQKLLGGLDRLIVKNAPAADSTAEPPSPSSPAPAVEPVPEQKPKSSRWKIFS
jgi:uncharacterized coiled-coil protein SlyX